MDPRPHDPVPSSSTAASSGPPASVRDSDEARLHQMGYAQELRRNMSGFSNFAVTGPRGQGSAEELAEAEKDIELAGGAA